MNKYYTRGFRYFKNYDNRHWLKKKKHTETSWFRFDTITSRVHLINIIAIRTANLALSIIFTLLQPRVLTNYTVNARRPYENLFFFESTRRGLLTCRGRVYTGSVDVSTRRDNAIIHPVWATFSPWPPFHRTCTHDARITRRFVHPLFHRALCPPLTNFLVARSKKYVLCI